MGLLPPCCRYLSVLLLPTLVAWADSPSYAYLATQPDMRWAYTLEQAPESCTIRVTLPGYRVEQVGSEAEIAIGGPSGWTRPGEPRLPVLPVVFDVAEGVDLTVTVQEGEPTLQAVGNVRPATRLESVPVDGLTEQVVTVARPSPNIYGNASWWPAALVDQREAKGQGRRFVRFGITPFRYHPVEGNLAFYSNLTVSVTFTPEAGAP
ncbi:MAG TPA: C25 family peptidase propeptide domain-containing protein [Kiritimatiellia bacterium]|nr:C25 family peptidase propeptide domain-containing protein [Kiritimatiellia bacterium]HMP34914.1 C25 family peptidase propeptide domain-containing protein [Kiritimatiellia bacterium]